MPTYSASGLHLHGLFSVHTAHATSASSGACITATNTTATGPVITYSVTG